MNYLVKIRDVIRHPLLFKKLTSFYWQGYLREIGWFESYQTQKPVGSNSDPIPWVTYAFIDFIAERLKADMTLLEYGSGYSTLFYSKHVGKVISVEHDRSWFEQISKDVPANVTVHHVALEYGGNYSTFARDHQITADIIVVDGRDRINCMKEGIRNLSSRGVMVLDDSERAEYQEGVRFVLDQGFRKIDFWGIAPGIFFKKCTTVFYRNQNCIDI